MVLNVPNAKPVLLNVSPSIHTKLVFPQMNGTLKFNATIPKLVCLTPKNNQPNAISTAKTAILSVPKTHCSRVSLSNIQKQTVNLDATKIQENAMHVSQAHPGVKTEKYLSATIIMSGRSPESVTWEYASTKLNAHPAPKTPHHAKTTAAASVYKPNVQTAKIKKRFNATEHHAMVPNVEHA